MLLVVQIAKLKASGVGQSQFNPAEVIAPAATPKTQGKELRVAG